jgi:transketolase
MKAITDTLQLSRLAYDVRMDVVKMTSQAASGHPGGSLGSADVFTALYFSGVFKHDPANPQWVGRDRFILSNGHICPVWYSVLAHAGYLPVTELATFRSSGSRLQGHPVKGALPVIEISTGSLGQGICASVGYALGLRLFGLPNKVFCSVGDGELEEGSTWEAAMSAAHYKLENLVVFCDRNGLQQNGSTEQLIGLEPLAAKYKDFGWRVFEADGNDIAAVVGAFNAAREPAGKPTMILFKTVMGKGVPFMEGDHQWHGKALPADKTQLALQALQSAQDKIV